ncbi:hypothetical protein SAMN02910301_0418 [Lachnospiraceae bacterium XBD2001]|nr:hypothetical protein SAMN02910301_0418 [Lachnospiraceae bacterium XBD2001]
MIDEMIKVHGIFWVHAGWFLLYVVALFYVLHCWEKIRKQVKPIAVAMIVVLLIMYNPVVIYFIKQQLFGQGTIEYTRVGWGLLVVPMVAYLGIELIDWNKKKAWNVLILMGVVLLVSVKNNTYHEMPENSYKISNEAIEIVGAMNATLPDANGYYSLIYFCPVTENMVGEMTVYDKIFSGITAYSSHFVTYCMDISYLNEMQNMYKYAIAQKGDAEELFATRGYVKIATTEHCDVYWYQE